MSEEKTWLTPSAHEKLVEEYEHMTTTGRVEITAKIAEARAHGDLKENAEYHAAKDEQGMQEARIRQIKHLLENSEDPRGSRRWHRERGYRGHRRGRRR